MSIHKVDGVDGNNNFPKKFVRLHATDTSGSRGKSLMINTSDTTNGDGFSVKIADAEDSPLFAGIADEAWTAAGVIRVQTAGSNNQCTADSGAGISIAALVGTGTGGANGSIQTVTGWSDSVVPFGICVNAFSASTADGVVLIWDRGMFG